MPDNPNTEQVSFIFEGKLSSQNKMDFYESARFQYSASRLLVKLDNFRRTGDFPAKISYKNTPEILLLPSRAGSFGLDVIGPALAIAGPLLIEAPLSAMLSYAIDRIFKSADDEAIREALATNRHLVQTFDRTISGRDDTINRTLDIIKDRLDKEDDLNAEIRSLHERIIADQERRLELANYSNAFRKINEDQEANLITMAAPLLKEMNVPLRRSASSAKIRSESDSKLS